MENERGARGGVVIDGDTTEGGQDDAFALAKIEEGDADVAQPGAEGNIDGGATDKEVGEDAGAVEVEVNSKIEDPRAKDDARIANVEKMLKEVADRVSAPAPVKERTPEEWATLEQEWGVPRGAIERTTRQSVTVYNKIMEMFDSRFAKYEMTESLTDLTKETGFNDAIRYKKDVTTYLSRYEPKYWTNPQLLKDAVIYARGLNANSNIQKVRTDNERNRVVIGRARPSSPAVGQRRGSPIALTASQKEAASHMPGGEPEYRKFMGKGRVTIE